MPNEEDEPEGVPDELRHLGRHELLLPLASGGMATVYLAKLTGTAGFERQVAVKICHPHLRREAEFVAMFVDEARLAARLHHPKIVPVLDIVETPVLHLVMDYVKGGSLFELLARAEHMPRTSTRPVLLRIICDMLEGLHAAHGATDPTGEPLELVHRDVSPQNILVGVDGIARVTDFGVARARSRITSTRPGDIKGKVGYLAPEALQNNHVGVHTDIFASGVVLWEALCHRRLLPKGAQVADPILDPSSVDPTILPALDALVRTATNTDPSARFANAEVMLEAIEACGERIADHREVSAWVEQLLGPDLEQREATLRALPSAPYPSAERPVSSQEPIGADVTTVDASMSEVSGVRATATTPSRTRSGRMALVAIASALVVSVGVWAALSSTANTAPPHSAASDSAPSPATSRPAASSPAARATMREEVAPSAVLPEPPEVESVPAEAAETAEQDVVSPALPRATRMNRTRMRRAPRESSEQPEHYRPESI